MSISLGLAVFLGFLAFIFAETLGVLFPRRKQRRTWQSTKEWKREQEKKQRKEKRRWVKERMKRLKKEQRKRRA